MIEITNMAFRYRRKQHLFEDFSIHVPAGRIVGLMGLNGSGKTTLMKLISGLRFRHAGDIRTLGADPSKRTPEMLEQLFFVPEDFTVPLAVKKVDQLEKMYSPFYSKFDHGLFEKALIEFSIPIDSKFKALSYGQKKKVILSFALAANVRLLLLDEPMNGLDIPGKTQLRKMIIERHSDDKLVLISTHQVREVEGLIDSIILIDQGGLVCNSTLDELAKKFVVETVPAVKDPEKVFYSEETPGGYHVIVRENNGLSEQQLDLETLFNAAIRNKAKITKYCQMETKK